MQLVVNALALAVALLFFRFSAAAPFSGVDQQQLSSNHAQLESGLYAEIFANYNSYFRPENRTTVHVELSIASIVDINEQEGHLTTTFIPKMTWIDPRLTWSTDANSKYKDVHHLQVPDSEIWLPDLEIQNRFKDTIHDNAMRSLVWIHSDGVIFYVPRRTYHTPCHFNLDNFPYDEQNCQIVLGSWAYLGNEVNFEMIDNGTDDDFFNLHTDFNLTSLRMKKREVHYGENPIPFVELVVYMTLTRRPSFFYYMYLMPANVLLFAMPLVHCLPSNSPNKFIVLASVLICAILMINTLEDFMPGYLSVSAPKILKLYLSCFLCTMASAIASCITLSISNTNVRTKRVPLVLQKLLSRSFLRGCENTPPTASYDYQLLHLERRLQGQYNGDSSQQEMTLRTERATDDDITNNGVTSGSSSRRDEDQQSNPVAQTLQHLVSELQLARYREQVKVEWLKLARFVDSIFAIVFGIAAFSILSVIHRTSHSHNSY